LDALSWPKPEPGLVIRYSYLWQSEADAGLEEGDKNRPCAIVLVILRDGDAPLVRVLPVTHSRPHDPNGAIEIPLQTKLRLGLDNDQSWIILDEANDFTWPGPDLRPRVNGEPMTVSYGHLPPGFMKSLNEKLVRRQKQLLAGIVQRTE
jgi:hypothetical protein